MNNGNYNTNSTNVSTLDMNPQFEQTIFKKPFQYSHQSILTIIMQYVSMFLFYISAFTFIIVHSEGYLTFAEDANNLPDTFYGFIVRALVILINALPIVSGVLGVGCVLVILIPQLICKNAAFIISLSAWSCILGMIWWLMVERVPIITMICALAGCIIFNFRLTYSICIRVNDIKGENRRIVGEIALVCLVPFYNIYWVYVKEKELVKFARQCGTAVTDRSIVYLILTAFGLGLISYCLITSQLNRINSELASPLKQE